MVSIFDRSSNIFSNRIVLLKWLQLRGSFPRKRYLPPQLGSAAGTAYCSTLSGHHGGRWHAGYAQERSVQLPGYILQQENYLDPSQATDVRRLQLQRDAMVLTVAKGMSSIKCGRYPNFIRCLHRFVKLKSIICRE